VRKDGTLGKEIVVPDLDAIQRYVFSAAALLYHMHRADRFQGRGRHGGAAQLDLLFDLRYARNL
jgi:hypothetical protein